MFSEFWFSEIFIRTRIGESIEINIYTLGTHILEAKLISLFWKNSREFPKTMIYSNV